MSRKEQVEMPASREKEAIAAILKAEGYIKKYEVLPCGKHKKIRIILKYTEDNRPVITGLRRISKPGRRVYVKKDKIPRVLNGLGIAILSTPKGILTGQQSVKANTGGELLCFVW